MYAVPCALAVLVLYRHRHWQMLKDQSLRCCRGRSVLCSIFLLASLPKKWMAFSFRRNHLRFVKACTAVLKTFCALFSFFPIYISCEVIYWERKTCGTKQIALELAVFLISLLPSHPQLKITVLKQAFEKARCLCYLFTQLGQYTKINVIFIN